MLKLGSRTLITSLLTVLLGIGLLLAGCGGGGGLSVGGGAGGGLGKSPIGGANIFARKADKTWTTSRVGYTASNGAITFDGLDQLSASDYPALLKSVGGRLKSGTGANFTGELRGILESSTSNIYMSPASTLVANLVEKGAKLATAKTKVRAIVQNSLGMKNVDPLGDFLASDAATKNNELAQQALLYAMGITDIETNSASMDNLLSKLDSCASALDSQGFDDYAAAESGFDGTGSLASYINDNMATLKQISADALGESLADFEAEADFEFDMTEKPEEFVIAVSTTNPDTDNDGRANAGVAYSDDTTDDYSAGNADNPTRSYIRVALTSTNGSTWADATKSKFYFSALPSVGTLYEADGTTEVQIGTASTNTYDAVTGNGQNPLGNEEPLVFIYEIPQGATTGEVSFTVEAANQDAFDVFRTIYVDIVDPTSTVQSASLAMTSNLANNLISMTDSATETTLTTAATYDVPSTDAFKAQVSILGDSGSRHDVADVNAKYYVSFLAPDGFVFRVSGTGDDDWVNYDQATLAWNAGTSRWEASIPTSVKIVAEEESPFGAYSFGAYLVDKDLDIDERSSAKTLYMIDSDYASRPAKIIKVRYNNGGSDTTKTQLGTTGGSLQFAATTNFIGNVQTLTCPQFMFRAYVSLHSSC